MTESEEDVLKQKLIDQIMKALPHIGPLNRWTISQLDYLWMQIENFQQKRD